MRQLRALGVGRGAVEKAVRAGRLHRLYRGVYGVGHTALRVEGRRFAAVLACGPGAVLSHRTAAAHWGLLRTDQVGIDVTAARGRHGASGIRLHRARSLDEQDTTRHRGIPTTTVHRTLLDVASIAHEGELERALAQAERLRIYDHRAVQAVLARANGHRGAAALGEAVAPTGPAAGRAKWTRNDWEAHYLALIRDAGLAEPEVNTSVAALDHEPFEVDFSWPSHRLIVEMDGWETHGTRSAFHRDRARDAALTASGYRVVRFTWRSRPEEVVARLRRLLPTAGSRPRSG